MQVWKPVEVDFNNISESKISLYDIAYGKYPALLVKNFYNKDSCRTIVNRINDISTFDYGTGIVKKVGLFLMAYVNNKGDYFSETTNVEKKFKILFDNLEDPRYKIQELIVNFMQGKGVNIAQENGQKYAAGIIRIHETDDFAPLHRDNAMYDANGFSVAYFQHQLSCILCLQQSESGGELVIYNKLWQPSDERFREIGFGYSKEVMHNTESIMIRANAGDLAIINPKYFHEILPVAGKTSRITFGIFIAFNDNGTEIVTWS